MYLEKFEVKNIKCFESVVLTFPKQDNKCAGWIVLLGGNGTGKSTLLQAMGISLVGPPAANRLLDPQGWVRGGNLYGEISAKITRSASDFQVVGQPRKEPYTSNFWVTGNNEVSTEDKRVFTQPQLVLLGGPKAIKSLSIGPYSGRKSAGWFSCGYGPFRRLTGGSQQGDKWTYSAGGESRFATLFSEAAALTNCTEWLTKLYSSSVDPNFQLREKFESDLGVVRNVLNTLLPNGVQLDKIDSVQPYFKTLGGVTVPMTSLSDGFRCFLSLVVDILRHIQESVNSLASVVDEHARITTEGVVLIDEIDAHLHPLWQRDIGFRLREVFPRLQFIVTTHSPFVAQAATNGGLFVLKPNAKTGVVEGVQPESTVVGWRADDILTSPLFGLSDTRDPDTAKLLQEHADLVAMRTWKALSELDKSRLAQIELKLAERLTAPGESVSERELRTEMSQYIKDSLKAKATQ